MSGISVLENDPYLQLKLGGVTLNNAGFVANAIKQKASELDLRERIEPVAKKLLLSEYAKPNLQDLAPGYRNSVNLKKGELEYFGYIPSETNMKQALQETNKNAELVGIFT